ncbi:porin family protein [Olleya sp. YS]|uniref:porin family protein n=1 Tax=Olleya sp. YS TaxID=3028318 RepID=UPI0024345DCF|nr:porin family protein [Olleya sp. YS]WGD33752.1 porin family protein [Olleya sp. YS]
MLRRKNNIKKLLCLTLLLSSFLCIGQTRDKGNIELTPIIGYSASYNIGSFIFGSSPSSGIHIGVYGNYYLNNRWSLQSGLLYQNMGTEKVKFFIFSDDYKEKSNYLTIPLIVNYHFGANRNWYFNYGVSLGFLTKIEGNYDDGNGYVDIIDIGNPIQFGLNSGIGYKFEISPNLTIVIDNYNMIGLTDTTDQRNAKNFYMSFNLGAVFKI